MWLPNQCLPVRDCSESPHNVFHCFKEYALYFITVALNYYCSSLYLIIFYPNRQYTTLVTSWNGDHTFRLRQKPTNLLESNTEAASFSVKVLLFWKLNPVILFSQLESQFIKFHELVSIWTKKPFEYVYRK